LIETARLFHPDSAPGIDQLDQAGEMTTDRGHVALEALGRIFAVAKMPAEPIDDLGDGVQLADNLVPDQGAVRFDVHAGEKGRIPFFEQLRRDAVRFAYGGLDRMVPIPDHARQF
jgi:hypothetical protein